MSDHWGTPDWLFAMFSDWHDPCPPFGCQGTHRDDLKGYWRHPKVYVNPPYSSPAPWVDKAIRTAAQGNTVAMLLRHDTSTQWYVKLKVAGARFLIVEGRLNFKNLENTIARAHNSPGPSVIALLPGCKQTHGYTLEDF